MTVKSVAEFIPQKWRAAIYTALGTAILLEALWNVVPTHLEGKLLGTLSILGFGLAAANAATGEPDPIIEPEPDLPPPPPPPPPMRENYRGEFQ